MIFHAPTEFLRPGRTAEQSQPWSRVARQQQQQQHRRQQQQQQARYIQRTLWACRGCSENKHHGSCGRECLVATVQGPSAGIPHGYNVCNRVHCMHTMYAIGMHTMYAIGYTVCTQCMLLGTLYAHNVCNWNAHNVCNWVHCMHTMYAIGMHTMYAIWYTVCTQCMQLECTQCMQLGTLYAHNVCKWNIGMHANVCNWNAHNVCNWVHCMHTMYAAWVQWVFEDTSCMSVY